MALELSVNRLRYTGCSFASALAEWGRSTFRCRLPTGKQRYVARRAFASRGCTRKVEPMNDGGRVLLHCASCCLAHRPLTTPPP